MLKQSTVAEPCEPTTVRLADDGRLIGAAGAYDKHWRDLGGVYLDEEAYREVVRFGGADRLAYHVDESREDEGPGALIIGTSTLLPGLVGEEFAMTRGHLHAKSDRSEMYHCIAGRGIMLLDTLDGENRALEMSAGDIVYVPGEWVHRSVNVGDTPFVTVFCYAADAGQNYNVISEAGGMSHVIVRDGGTWARRPNPRHTGYRVPTADAGAANAPQVNELGEGGSRP